MKRAFPIFALLTAVLLSYALYEALVAAPTEQTMGNVQRIFYYHVPSAWTAFLLFTMNFVASVWYLISRSSKADAIAVVTAEVGVVFCTVVLVTGPLWARPVWGIWWTWDVRLTSTLVLWLIYISYLMLRRFSTSGQTPVLAAALAIFGALDIPLARTEDYPDTPVPAGELSADFIARAQILPLRDMPEANFSVAKRTDGTKLQTEAQIGTERTVGRVLTYETRREAEQLGRELAFQSRDAIYEAAVAQAAQLVETIRNHKTTR